ncbi:hypothetical protein [Hymenobacter chitinivorans]|uniref:DUF481 domain-containing protein n=1 Tax=Hymenobacter chitinivorans DSM 11115 TaxID=1121954 RepID=A0A2M9B9V9_9BACT|nr:hypothetical protein [Hymenobacter chitinivorans]PJJ54722.1 hypothetical protein CLV45_3068 [Hymenobacter chitinivorans DSM 11115]
MRLISRFLLLTSLVGGATAAQAQRRVTRDLLLVPEVQAELLLGNNSLRLGFNRLVQTNGGGDTFLGGQLRAGYEHFWNERWSGGATLRMLRSRDEGRGDFLGQSGTVTPGLLLRHRSALGKFTFGQRLGAEYGVTIRQNLGSDFKDRGLGRLRLDVERSFALSEKLSLRPRLAYEAAAYLRLQRDDTEAQERVVDFSNLRAEVGVRFSPRFDVTPWVSSQVQYINALPQFDLHGQQVGGGRTNLRTPQLGLDLRLTFSGATPATLPQLPTQY